MQLQLPIFPSTTKLINSNVGVFHKDEFVYYLHNGSPVYCHKIEDREGFRYILASLVNSGLCKCSEIADALGIHRKNVERYSKALREKGTKHFLNREDGRGQCHKMTEGLISQAEELLNQGYSQKRTAEMLNVSEGAIRYHIRKGKIKKKSNPG
jgi:transposase